MQCWQKSRNNFRGLQLSVEKLLYIVVFEVCVHSLRVKKPKQ